MTQRMLCTMFAFLFCASCGQTTQSSNTAQEKPVEAKSSPTTPPPEEKPTAKTVEQNTPTEKNTDETIPFYFDREITNSDLENRSLRELSLMRNTIFARAGNPFRKEWLDQYFTAQPWYKALEKMDASKISELDRKNAKTIATYEAELSKEDLKKRKTELLARKESSQPTPEDEIELKLISARLGVWIGEKDAPVSERTPLEDPSLLDKLLTVEQLDNMSPRDLRILRNTVYARHGRTFKSDVLTDYFYTTDWYDENPEFSDKLLTKTDRRNIKLIRSVEDSLGGPLSDYDHMEEDGWFSGA